MSYRTIRPFALGVILFAAGILGGCGLFSLDENSEDVRELIEQNRETWEEGNLTSYQFTYNKTLGDMDQDSIQVTVRGGQIDSVSVAGQGVDNPDAYLTVDRLFEEIVTNFEREDRGQFRVQFNEEFGYPKRYRMEAGEATRGRGVVVTSFSPRPDPAISGAQTDERRVRSGD